MDKTANEDKLFTEWFLSLKLQSKQGFSFLKSIATVIGTTSRYSETKKEDWLSTAEKFQVSCIHLPCYKTDVVTYYT